MKALFPLVLAAGILGATPSPGPSQSPASAAPVLYSAVITCPQVRAYIWHRGNWQPQRTNDAPFQMGATFTVVGDVRQAINARDTFYYETTIPIVELGPDFYPHYYVPRDCVAITGREASPAPR